ncbi:MAG: hypothetical protein AABW41_02760 [Nanoarchaeota archaeon]
MEPITVNNERKAENKRDINKEAMRRVNRFIAMVIVSGILILIIIAILIVWAIKSLVK